MNFLFQKVAKATGTHICMNSSCYFDPQPPAIQFFLEGIQEHKMEQSKHHLQETTTIYKHTYKTQQTHIHVCAQTGPTIKPHPH